MSDLAKGESVGERARGRRVASFLGSCFELTLFALALSLTLPVVASERAGYNVDPVAGPVVFGAYCFVGWRRAGKCGWIWLAKATIFTVFVLLFAAMIGGQLP